MFGVIVFTSGVFGRRGFFLDVACSIVNTSAAYARIFPVINLRLITRSVKFSFTVHFRLEVIPFVLRPEESKRKGADSMRVR